MKDKTRKCRLQVSRLTLQLELKQSVTDARIVRKSNQMECRVQKETHTRDQVRWANKWLSVSYKMEFTRYLTPYTKLQSRQIHG